MAYQTHRTSRPVPSRAPRTGWTASTSAPHPTSPLRAICYLRISTTRQVSRNGEPEGLSVPAQRAACRRRAHELGALVTAEFVERGRSGTSMNRPELQCLCGQRKHLRAEQVELRIRDFCRHIGLTPGQRRRWEVVALTRPQRHYDASLARLNQANALAAEITDKSTRLETANDAKAVPADLYTEARDRLDREAS